MTTASLSLSSPATACVQCHSRRPSSASTRSRRSSCLSSSSSPHERSGGPSSSSRRATRSLPTSVARSRPSTSGALRRLAACPARHSTAMRGQRPAPAPPSIVVRRRRKHSRTERARGPVQLRSRFDLGPPTPAVALRGEETSRLVIPRAGGPKLRRVGLRRVASACRKQQQSSNNGTERYCTEGHRAVS